MQHPMDIPLVRLRRERHSTFRTRALVATAVLIALVAGAIAWNTRHSSTLPISTEWTTKRLPGLGIQFSYPASWHLQDIDHGLTMAVITGALISNVDHGFEHPDLGPNSATSAFDMRGLPSGIVVLAFEQFDRHNMEAGRTSRFPLTLERAVVSNDADYGPTYGAPQPRYFIPFAVKGYLHSGVHVHIGDVTDEERTAIDLILASVKPLP